MFDETGERRRTPCEIYDAEMWFSGHRADKAAAKNLCKKMCHRTEACLQSTLEFESLSNDTRYGIFGGLDPDERKKMKGKVPA